MDVENENVERYGIYRCQFGVKWGKNRGCVECEPQSWRRGGRRVVGDGAARKSVGEFL